jgi:hypothetical protein
MQLWPVHPQPYPDELLSSWLTRIAIRSGFNLKTLCQQLLESDHASPREIDRVYNDNLIQNLAEGTGQPQETVLKSTLADDEGYVFLNRSYGMNHWIFPTTIFKKMAHNGLAYCPECLATDAEPYYRKSWRYAFNPVCPVHRRFLKQACPCCKAPFVYFATATIPNDRTMHYCLNCGYWLGDWPAELDEQRQTIDRLIDIQALLANGIARNAFTLPNYGTAPAIAYLQILHTLAYAMRLPEKAALALKHYPNIPADLSLSPLEQDHPSLPLEMRHPESIGVTLCLASTLIADWPACIVKLDAIRAFSGRSDEQLREIPLSILESLKDILPSRTFKSSDKEIESASLLLRGKLVRKEIPQELTAFMKSGRAVTRKTISSVKQADHLLSVANFELGDTPKTKVKGPRTKDREYTRKLINMSAEEIAKVAVLRKSKIPDKEDDSKPKQLGLF